MILVRSFIYSVLLASSFLPASLAADAASTLVLSGELTGSVHETYEKLEFEVPEGTSRITVRFEYERDDHTVVDLGLFDPERFRGWSGGNKSSFTLAESDATPSYLPGPLPAGTWTLILGVPNIRQDSVAAYRAEIRFESGVQAASRPFADKPLNTHPGWYRGELHAHTGHSDGSCLSQSGLSVPCPVHRSVEAAAARGLDFLAVTEHNAISHHQSLRELQIAFDEMVLLAGREITTFYGHANVFGTTAFIDFRATQDQMDSVLREVSDGGGIVSINHPGLPSGEACMGCGWVADTDYSLINAVEVVNGSVVDSSKGALKGPLSGIPFWENLLNKGYRLTGIAGTDNHSADLKESSNRRSALGEITTVVFADSLSQPHLLQGIKNGRVFIDLEGSPDRLLDIQATAMGETAMMGEILGAGAGESIAISVMVENVADANIVLYRNGEVSDSEIQHTRTGTLLTGTSHWSSDGSAEWVRAEVVSEDNRVLLMSNPIYINFAQSKR